MDSRDAEQLENQLLRATRSRRFTKVVGTLRACRPGRHRARAAMAVYLVETNARPAWCRLIEWTVFYVGRSILLPPRHLPRTRGPFQIEDARFRMRDAVPCAVSLLPDRPISARELAVFWNGAHGLEPGQRWSYRDVLAVALGVIDEAWWGRSAGRDYLGGFAPA